MKKTKVAVLGASGMLGSMVLDVLYRLEKYQLVASVYKPEEKKELEKKYPEIETVSIDVEKMGESELKKVLKGVKWIINCIGLIKPYIHDDNPEEIRRAIRINALFPDNLAQAALKNKAKVIQIETDCVFSGLKGNYNENDPHDALDVYGKTKSLGETYLGNVIHLRNSIIGPEPKAHVSLMDWFLYQPENAKVSGYANHKWNGVTTYHFAKICQGIIDQDLEIKQFQHVIPANKLSKAKMLAVFAKNFDRRDIQIEPVKAAKVIDRTLATIDTENNLKIWQAAGYEKPPKIEQMIGELGEYLKNA